MIVVLTATVQLCGINAIYFYTFEVLQTAGFDERMISYMTLSVGLSELIATAVCSSIIERLGRKVLLWGGYTLMGSVLALLTMTLSLQVKRQQPSAYLLSISPPFWSCLTGYVGKLDVILIFLFVTFYGMGPCEYINSNTGRKFCIILVGGTTGRGRTN
uniref:Uncharacterized protein n=1 Tax=Melopsittacus undulatus TaxID=13146 RepID=A0A8C6JV18_MELUD